LPRHEQDLWDGTPLAGARVLVRCYHGLGDVIQFARYAPLLKAVARSVTFWAQPAVIPLLRTVCGIDRLLPLHDGAPDGDYDVDIEVMELPHAFRSTLATLPRTVPYIHVPPADLTSLPPAAKRVGLFWQTGNWDPRRAVPPSLVPILADARAAVVHGPSRLRGSGSSGPVIEIPHEDDLWGTARIMRSFDLVIAADSMPAHLAGALAVPVWVLLHAEPDWRWMIDRDDSPWYPTMRLFRQRTAGEWFDVVTRVAEELGSERGSGDGRGSR